MWCIPAPANAAFVCQMETVLAVYRRASDSAYPERRHFSRNPKWGPSDFGFRKNGDAPEIKASLPVGGGWGVGVQFAACPTHGYRLCLRLKFNHYQFWDKK